MITNLPQKTHLKYSNKRNFIFHCAIEKTFSLQNLQKISFNVRSYEIITLDSSKNNQIKEILSFISR